RSGVLPLRAPPRAPRLQARPHPLTQPHLPPPHPSPGEFGAPARVRTSRPSNSRRSTELARCGGGGGGGGGGGYRGGTAGPRPEGATRPEAREESLSVKALIKARPAPGLELVELPDP